MKTWYGLIGLLVVAHINAYDRQVQVEPCHNKPTYSFKDVHDQWICVRLNPDEIKFARDFFTRHYKPHRLLTQLHYELRTNQFLVPAAYGFMMENLVSDLLFLKGASVTVIEALDFVQRFKNE